MREGSNRYIARCEHGTLNVVWNNAAFYLNREGLVELGEMLDGAQTMQRVRPADFAWMQEMVKDALLFLDKERTPTNATPFRNPFPLDGFTETDSRGRWN